MKISAIILGIENMVISKVLQYHSNVNFLH